MHSSHLRPSDFEIVRSEAISHEAYFEGYSLQDRLGLVTTDPMDGLGAAAIVLAHVTAFYDRYREDSDEFFAYPDNFSFQKNLPLGRYDWFDIWPEEKNVHLSADPWNALSTIASRAITILLIPEVAEPTLDEPEDNRERSILESLRRQVHTCYVYSPAGSTDRPDTTICCSHADVEEWGLRILASGEGDFGERRSIWDEAFVEGKLTQTYRRVDLDRALASFFR